MQQRRHRWVLFTGCFTLLVPAAFGQVFVVGEKTATSEISTDFTPTSLPLPSGKLGERGRRELVRMLDAEQGFAHRPLPMGTGIVLHVNGELSPGPSEYRQLIYKKGQAAALGDRVIITSMEIKPDRIIFDLNGGPYAKHRFLSHVQLNDNPVVQNQEKPTGSRVTLLFNGPIPEISAPEIKSLLEPVIDFGVKTSEEAYADTLPKPLKDAIAEHQVLVGMNHRMVLAALGAPESKMREKDSGDPNGARYEEWIYGHVPQTVKFIRFVGDRVSLVEIAALGKPMEIHDKDELAGYLPPPPTREIALGDRKPTEESGTPQGPPTLRAPGETLPDTPAVNGSGNGKVQFPKQPDPVTPAPSAPPSQFVARVN